MTPWSGSAGRVSVILAPRPLNRLQLILAHERNGRSSSPDYLPQLQRELVAVISKYVSINPDDIKVHMERQGDFDVLEVKIELPEAPTGR